MDLKANIDMIERLGRFVREEGLTMISIGDICIQRDPKETYYGALGKAAAKVEAAPTVSDEEILMNPMAGLDGLNG